MEANTILGLRVSRSDVAFIHDALMACQFQGEHMLQAAGIIGGLRHALTLAAPVTKPEAPKTAPEAAKAKTSEPVAPAPTPLRDVPPVPAPAPTVHTGGKKRKR